MLVGGLLTSGNISPFCVDVYGLRHKRRGANGHHRQPRAGHVADVDRDCLLS
jgi:hypothetical protein